MSISQLKATRKERARLPYNSRLQRQEARELLSVISRLPVPQVAKSLGVSRYAVERRASKARVLLTASAFDIPHPEQQFVAEVDAKIDARRHRAKSKSGKRRADERDGITPSERRAINAQRRARRSSTRKPARAPTNADKPQASEVVKHKLTPDWRPAKPQTLSEIERAGAGGGSGLSTN